MWRWILDQDSGTLNLLLERPRHHRHRIPWLTCRVALIAMVGVNIWIGIPFNLTILYSGLQEIPEELYEAGRWTGRPGGRRSGISPGPSAAVVSVVLMLGVVYTLKVLDIILGLTHGGPANSTQTIATQSYPLSFIEFKFGEGAALCNMLVVISLVFAVLYLRATRRRWTSRERRRLSHSPAPEAGSVPPSPSCCWPSCCSRSTGWSHPCSPPAPPWQRRAARSPSFDGYPTAIADQGGNLVTSMIISLGMSRWAWPSPRPRPMPWPSSVPLDQWACSAS